MIENEIKEQTKVTTKTSTVTSPISKSDKKETGKKANAFVAWLKDADTVDEAGKIDGKTAATSYAKGLIEIVKTVYKKPIASIVTVATGAVIAFYGHMYALAAVMGLAIVAGVAGAAYGVYTIKKATTNNEKIQGYEILGISTFVIGVGIYGLTI